jgi:DNA-binding NtrC family response regulator
MRKRPVEKKPLQRPVRGTETGADAHPKDGQKPQKLWMVLEEFEKQFLLNALKQNRGHRGKTAAMLGIDRKTLYMKLKKYGVI